MRKAHQLCWVLALSAVVPVASTQSPRQDPTTGAGLDLRLIEAVQRRDQSAVLALIADGVDVTVTRSDGSTPLAWAALRDDAGITAALLRAGANPNTTDENGETPLLFASARGNLAIARLLLNASAAVDAVRWSGDTPLLAGYTPATWSWSGCCSTEAPR